MKALYLPPPDRYIGVDPCPMCRGRRVAGPLADGGVRDIVDGGAPLPFAVDRFCAGCGGCGRATHEDCDLTQHADVDRGEWPEELFEVERDCGSCSDRGWWSCQGFEGDDVVFLRMPCGCAQSLLFTIVVDEVDSRRSW